ncbi:ABC transporter ATP-binding protein [Pseudothermotoga thermarum]|uniref:Oligopeptide/dipeptide ABC transporter, ATPase subunit n=1 Tax=Pseudothermotoga thermarum DSM 5069 TaxID=688269 RepID=F7YUQ8_9THEM|nr:ABC transporter ATP-binding protein [Pseudothermotoga thermarum]AEH50243.1 oligopeptide/dipeptide ABC transporter, ATPase subunit [Pseudothermotoga thermarum DSM 5069]
MRELLEVKGLTKIYSLGSIFSRIKITAVEDVNFEVMQPEIFTLAGESGCGKTTTAKIILGFEEQTSGMVFYRGKPINELRKKDKIQMLREIQAVFQNPFSTFNPLRTVDSYFYETLLNLKIVSSKKEAEKKIEEKLAAVGISFEEFTQRYPNEFSGGQLQRLSIARALLTDPSLIVADEPVSMVDASLRMSIVNLFKDLKEKYSVSVIYITHDLTTAYYVSDRIAIMFRGNIVEMGPAEEVLSNPKHPYTQLLRESVPEPDPEKRWGTKVVLADTEHEEYLRIGCKFAGRCPSAMEKCKKNNPPYFKVNDVLVKCFLYK